MPTGIKHLFIFSAAAFVGSAVAYYTNLDPTGLMCGVLALVYFGRK